MIDQNERRVIEERVVQTPQGASATVVDQRTSVLPTPAENAWDKLGRWEQVVWLIAGIIAVLIAIRSFRVVLGADMTQGFGLFVFSITQPFDFPFLTLFSEQGKATARGSYVEMGSLVAIVVYLLLAYVVNRVLRLVMAPRVAASRS